MSKSPPRWVWPPVVVAAVLLWTVVMTMPDRNLHVHVLDVGQGDAILIQRGQQQVVIDGGPSPQRLVEELGNIMPFWDRTIELVVLTHPNADHITGLLELFDRYRVRRVIYPDLDYHSTLYAEWRERASESDAVITLAQAGQLVSLGEDVVIEVINPPASLLSGTESDVDNNGVALRLEVGEQSFLFMADLMWQAELDLIYDRAALESTVLKVGHHGSATSTRPEFLAVVNPQVAVISVGADNDYGHPAPEVLSRLQDGLGIINIYRTDRDGSIEFITDGDKLWVETEH